MPKIPTKPNGSREPRVIGVVGSRRRSSLKDRKILKMELEKLYQPGDSFVSGGCQVGADRFIEEIAREWGVSITIHYPRKENLDTGLAKKDSKAAFAEINYARNALIAEDCGILIAMVAFDRRGGTEDTIAKAHALSKAVILLQDTH